MPWRLTPIPKVSHTLRGALSWPVNSRNVAVYASSATGQASDDTMVSRYLPAFREDMHLIYHGPEMKNRIQYEYNGYAALKKRHLSTPHIGGDSWSQFLMRI